MNTLNIVKERKAQILAVKLINKLGEILNQIYNTYDILLNADSFSTANKCNKQLKNLVNIAVYYLIVADSLAIKYQGELVNNYSISQINDSNRRWKDSNLYSLLTAKVKEISETLNKIQ